MKTAPPADPAVFGYEIDTDAWVKSGKLQASDIKVIKIPGVETARKWLGSSSPAQFNQGIVTAIFQLATLRFAYQDLAQGDRFSHNEDVLKLTGAMISILGNIVETVSETIAKAPHHPLSSFIMKQWAWFDRDLAKTGARVGRWAGAAAGVVLAGYDLFKNAPEAFKNHNSTLGWLYGVNGAFAIYLAASPFFSGIPLLAGWLPPAWLALVALMAIGLLIAKLKPAAINDWVQRCSFGTGERYYSLDEELKAFNSAVGA